MNTSMVCARCDGLLECDVRHKAAGERVKLFKGLGQ